MAAGRHLPPAGRPRKRAASAPPARLLPVALPTGGLIRGPAGRTRHGSRPARPRSRRSRRSTGRSPPGRAPAPASGRTNASRTNVVSWGARGIRRPFETRDRRRGPGGARGRRRLPRTGPPLPRTVRGQGDRRRDEGGTRSSGSPPRAAGSPRAPTTSRTRPCRAPAVAARNAAHFGPARSPRRRVRRRRARRGGARARRSGGRRPPRRGRRSRTRPRSRRPGR